MANIAIDFNPVAEPFPFDTTPVGGEQFERSALPRARICFRVNEGAVAAKIATNTQTLRIANLLPRNYAYTLEFLYASILFGTAGDADHYEDVSWISTMLGDGQGRRNTEMFSQGSSPGLLMVGLTKIWQPLNKFTMPIFNVQANPPSIDIQLFDSDAVNATASGSVSTLACFLQYDLEQAYNIGLNFPLPVQHR